MPRFTEGKYFNHYIDFMMNKIMESVFLKTVN